MMLNNDNDDDDDMMMTTGPTWFGLTSSSLALAARTVPNFFSSALFSICFVTFELIFTLSHSIKYQLLIIIYKLDIFFLILYKGMICHELDNFLLYLGLISTDNELGFRT